jgi:hypothetical protein
MSHVLSAVESKIDRKMSSVGTKSHHFAAGIRSDILVSPNLD